MINRSQMKFSDIKIGSPIEVFAVNKAFLDDHSPNKVNLSVGAYRTEDGKPWVLPIVSKVENLLTEDGTANHEYLPVLGMESFSLAATKMLLGDDSKPLTEGRAFGIQTLSGTGALRIGAAFLHAQLNCRVVYISEPSWENHQMVFRHAGFSDIRTYRYWNPTDRKIDSNGLFSDLSNAPECSVIVLHACAHNPTGCDLSQDEWKTVAEIISKKKLFPFLDCAYQGFASGDLERDSWAVRYFAENLSDLFCAQSFAKNFGLYNERIGNLTCVLSSKEFVVAVKSQFTLLVRGMYSNPPSHGARIVSTILNNPVYFVEWISCIKKMSQRIIQMREGLRKRLEDKQTPGKWEHITDQIGMFSYTGLTEKQVEYLAKKHIYLLKSGRINMCGLNDSNLDYVADSFFEAITTQ